MVGYSTATMVYMNKVLVGSGSGKKLTAFDQLRPLQQQIREKANAMLNITDHLYLLEEELDTALKAIPELKAQIAHLNEEIYTILSKMRGIQPHLTVANLELTHEFTGLTLNVGRLSESNDGKVEELVQLSRKVAQTPAHADRLAKRWLRMSKEMAAMMQEWLDKANEASSKGDSTAENEGAALLSEYNGAMTADR